MIDYRVTLIDAPDGRVVESVVRTDRADAEANVVRLVRLAGEDQMVVFEVGGSGLVAVDDGTPES